MWSSSSFRSETFLSSDSTNPSCTVGMVPSDMTSVVLPDLGQSEPWRETCAAWHSRFATLPHLVRVVRLGEGRAAVLELRTDADGFGSLTIVGVVSERESLDAARALAGRHGIVVLDSRLASSNLESFEDPLIVGDDEVHAALILEDEWITLRSIESLRREIAEGLTSRSSHQRRSVLRVLRDEILGYAYLRSRARAR